MLKKKEERFQKQKLDKLPKLNKPYQFVLFITQTATAATGSAIITGVLKLTGCVYMAIRVIPGETAGKVTGVISTVRGRNKCRLYEGLDC